jgi:hypothetical protein
MEAKLIPVGKEIRWTLQNAPVGLLKIVLPPTTKLDFGVKAGVKNLRSSAYL